MALLDTLLEIERDFWLVRERQAYFDEHLAGDAVLVFHVGVMDRREAVEGAAGTSAWDEVDFDDVRLLEPAEGAALLVSRVEARRGGEAYAAWCSSLYARESDGPWRLAFHQQSPVAGG